jgi:hypothetical protein
MQRPSVRHRIIYDEITKAHVSMFGDCMYDGQLMRDKTSDWQRQDRRGYREWINMILAQFPETAGDLTWRDVKVQPNKFKHCAECGRIFYDLSRNGRAKVCHYVPFERWNQRKRRYETRTKYGYQMSECEVERDNKQTRKDKGITIQYTGAATDYSAKTRERIERQLFVWTSFQSDNPEDSAYIDSLLIQATPYAMNGKRKAGMVISKEWPEKRSHFDAMRYQSTSGKTFAYSESTTNIYDLTWDQIKEMKLDRYFTRKEFIYRQTKQ